MAETPVLLPHHQQQLTQGSGIVSEVIAERGYRSILAPGGYSALKPYGFTRAQANLPGLLLPVWTTDGTNGLMVYRPDAPRLGKDGKAVRYEFPKGASVRLDCPPRCRPMLGDPRTPLWLTEGMKKADALASHGLCAIALLGVWNFKGKNPFGGTTLLADFDYIAWIGRDVRIVFDSDVMTKTQVRQALDRLTEHLQRKGANVVAVYLPQEDGSKVGADDVLLTHILKDLEGLIEAPRLQPQAAAPVVELLPCAPARLSRPLMLVEGHAYTVAWLWTRETVTEIADRKTGEITRLSEPIVHEGQRLFVVRADGTIFGELSDRNVVPMHELGLTVHLPEVPRDSRLWSAPGVNAYRLGYRADTPTVFGRVVDVVDRFIDFNKSLADQRTMAEFVACYVLSTYFLDAFTVIGFLWPNGDRGSGKTQLLLVVTELAYLGETILAGGSYACLRDLADYGATLAFDDAEGLSDPKRTDPDKRALLLAGNRKGNTVPVKEPGPNGTWHTRYVNTFCPRLFSAIRLPDNVLASRSIVVPLIRTPDPHRANADPLDNAVWPHDRDTLKDDLWALALENLPKMPRYVAQVNRVAQLSGRTLEPWRPILAVARWLEDTGVQGIWDRMQDLSQAYQEERPDLESADLQALVIKALCHYAMNSMRAINEEGGQEFTCITSNFKDEVITIAEDEEIDIDTSAISTKRVGRVLGRMRFRQKPRAGGKGARQWRVLLPELQGWAKAYGISLPTELTPHFTNGSHGTDDPSQDDMSAPGTSICRTHGETAMVMKDGSNRICGECLGMPPERIELLRQREGHG
jgi:Domain of unknown function (DUF3854)